MVNQRELILFGLLLGTLSLSCAQARAADVAPVPPPPAAPAAAPVPPPDASPSALPSVVTSAEEQVAGPTDLYVLFDGENTIPPLVSMGGWGYIQQDATLNPFEPKRLTTKLHSPYYLLISSLGRYQGIRFDFTQPLPTAELLNAKNVFLELDVRGYEDTSDNSLTTPTAAPPRPRGPMGGPPSMMASAASIGGITPWTTPGTLTPQADDEDKLPDSAYPSMMRIPPLSVPLPRVTDIRFTFYTDKGAVTVVEPFEHFFPKEEINRQWIRLAIPLSTLNSSFPLGSKLTRLVITSDKPASYDKPITFGIGRMAFVKDETPIVIHPFIYPAFIEMGKRIFFSSKADYGLTHVETTWRFDNGSGTPIDVKGDRTTYTFDKDGIYTITCTVRDPSGGKDPVKQDIVVKVSQPAGGISKQ